MMKWLAGSRRNGVGREFPVIVLYVAWGLFANLCILWILTPLVQDLASLGVFCLLAVTGLWLFSIPVSVRRQWWVFTIASILFGQGLLQWSLRPALHPAFLIVLMSIGLVVLACWFGRIPMVRLIAAIGVLAVINAWVPIRTWAFLTHFSVSFDAQVPLNTAAFPQTPLLPVQTAGGPAVITMENAAQSTSVPFLRQTYRYVAIQRMDTQWTVRQAAPAQLAALNPFDVISAASPLYPMAWTAKQGSVTVSLATAATSNDYAQMTTSFADVPADAAALMQRAQDIERRDWLRVLAQSGVQPAPRLQIENGVLTGNWQGHTLHLHVDGNHVVGMGSFTGPDAHELLVEGLDDLQVVSLDGTPHIVSTLHVDLMHPIAGNLLIGPFSTTGKDAVYVNGSPSRILVLDRSGQWHQVYAASHTQLRFLAVVQFAGDKSPEILTDDPGDMSAQLATDYFTSYTWRAGHLIRNWRIFRTDVSSMVPLRQSAEGPVQLVGILSGSNRVIVLTRHQLSVLPPAVALLALSIGAGYAVRVWQWRCRRRA